MNLLIISHTPHYKARGQIVGWGPTVREIDQLASLFTRIEHLAPLHADPTPASALPYTRKNIDYTPVKPAGGEGVLDKLGVIWRIPDWISDIRKAMKKADIFHIRCPAGISLVGLLVVRFWGKGKPCWVKYAGNWQPEGKEPLSYRLQRWLLLRNWHHGVVTINGHWPDQADHIVTFNNPSMTQAEYAHGCLTAKTKVLAKPIQLLFVGRLDQAKGLDRLLKIAVELKQASVDFELTLVGDSPQRRMFETFVEDNGLTNRVHFLGWQPMSTLHEIYKKAHLLVFPSTTEGWPKVVSEAMAHGVVPIASAISSIPQTLTQIGAGKAIPSNAINKFVKAIRFYIDNPKVWQAECDKCIAAGAGYTYSYYLEAVRTLFLTTWKIKIPDE